VKRKVAKKNQKKVVECSEKKVRLKKEENGTPRCSRYCGMCYRKLKDRMKSDGTKFSGNEKKGLCNISSMGCPSCEEPICDKCWIEGYDMHKKRNA
jgi:hypothetical protein